MSFIKVIIDEMSKGNFSFLILIVGLLQLVVMIGRGKKGKKMTPQVYKNIKQLSYKELLDAVERMKHKLYETGSTDYHADFMYYLALLSELDDRQVALDKE